MKARRNRFGVEERQGGLMDTVEAGRGGGEEGTGPTTGVLPLPPSIEDRCPRCAGKLKVKSFNRLPAPVAVTLGRYLVGRRYLQCTGCGQRLVRPHFAPSLQAALEAQK